jgi:hypothetical protein
MKIKYLIWGILAMIIHSLCCYYVMIFCTIYKNSAKEWFIGCLMTFGIDFLIISPSICLIKVILRFVVRVYPSRFTYWIFTKFQYISMFIDC